MKITKIISSLLLLLLSLSTYGQEFILPIFFEDSIGNKDTVIIGYDTNATYSIDEDFDEVDIIDSSYNEEFEVRASIYDYNELWENDGRIIESKIMIIGNVCNDPNYYGESNSIMVLIKSDHWPITVRWNSDLFQEQCNFTEIVNCKPGGWFDVCGEVPTQIEMMEQDSVTYIDTDYKLELENDTLRGLFFPFYNSINVSVEDKIEEDKIILFPNPSSDEVEFKIGSEDGQFDNINIKIFDKSGKEIMSLNVNEKIDISTWLNGVYYYMIYESNILLKSGKFVKY